MKSKVKKIELDVHVHATERDGLFENAIKNIFGKGSIKVETLQGHYGNEIKRIIFTAFKKDAEEVARSLLKKLGAFESGIVLNELMKGLDRNTLYVRLDKQKLAMGTLELDGDNEVKIIINFYSEKDAKDFLLNKA